MRIDIDVPTLDQIEDISYKTFMLVSHGWRRIEKYCVEDYSQLCDKYSNVKNLEVRYLWVKEGYTQIKHFFYNYPRNGSENVQISFFELEEAFENLESELLK